MKVKKGCKNSPPRANMLLQAQLQPTTEAKTTVRASEIPTRHLLLSLLLLSLLLRERSLGLALEASLVALVQLATVLLQEVRLPESAAHIVVDHLLGDPHELDRLLVVQADGENGAGELLGGGDILGGGVEGLGVRAPVGD